MKSLKQVHDLPLWRQIQRQNFTNISALAEFLQLGDQESKHFLPFSKFPLNLPRRLAEKIEKGTLDDPILRQFVPLQEEGEEKLGFTSDPVCESGFRKGDKLLHKYDGRVLILATSACAMHCRFCFRREFEYATTVKGFEEELAYLASNTDIREVILSGGDPLSLSDGALSTLFERIGQMAHVKRIRFHTRFPLGIPERIDEEFLTLLANARQQVWFLIQCNHARELDDAVLAALKSVLKLGIPVLSQTVLLRGVNDTVEALSALFERLVDHGVQPYYLHQLDRVRATAHFEVSEAEGKALMAALRSRLSGYAVPRYVREVAGERSKLPVE